MEYKKPKPKSYGIYSRSEKLSTTKTPDGKLRYSYVNVPGELILTNLSREELYKEFKPLSETVVDLAINSYSGLLGGFIIVKNW